SKGANSKCQLEKNPQARNKDPRVQRQVCLAHGTPRIRRRSSDAWKSKRAESRMRPTNPINPRAIGTVAKRSNFLLTPNWIMRRRVLRKIVAVAISQDY